MSAADPYTAKASTDATPQEKLAELNTIIDATKTAMLVTRSPDGTLHSRAMVPASKKGLVLEFIANNHSGKFDDLASHPEVNISFYDPSSTNWISLAGKAKIIEDPSEIKKIWHPAVKAWFGDLGDGKHTGDFDDPRVSAIQIIPDEIRYWYARGTIDRLYEVAKGTVTGEVAAPGSLKVVSKQELVEIRDLVGKAI